VIPKATGSYFNYRRGRRVARGTDALGAGLWLPLNRDVELVRSLMSETRTLHFENARQLQSLYANDS